MMHEHAEHGGCMYAKVPRAFIDVMQLQPSPVDRVREEVLLEVIDDGLRKGDDGMSHW
jgi:hypothetical protein